MNLWNLRNLNFILKLWVVCVSTCLWIIYINFDHSKINCMSCRDSDDETWKRTLASFWIIYLSKQKRRQFDSHYHRIESHHHEGRAKMTQASEFLILEKLQIYRNSIMHDISKIVWHFQSRSRIDFFALLRHVIYSRSQTHVLKSFMSHSQSSKLLGCRGEERIDGEWCAKHMLVFFRRTT